MVSVLSALGPIFLMILLGALLKRGMVFPRLGLGDAFWDATERLTYYVLFPAMLLTRVAGSSVGELQILPMAAALVAPILMIIGWLLLMRGRLNMDMPALTSVMQGAIRPNIYVVIAAASALYGAAGNTLVAIAIAVVVPTVNVLSVILLARLNGTAEPGSRSIVRALASNPIILAVFLGLALNGLNISLPPILGPALDAIGRAALPIGLLCVGAGLDFAAAKAGQRGILISGFLKLLLLPTLTAFACFVFGVEGLTAKVAVLFSGTPAASSSYILARQMGGDHRLMAGILTAQVIAAAVTLPVVVMFLM